MFAGVPSTKPSAASTSGTVAASAGETVTSIPSSSGSRAPATTASSIACSAGDDVWWTISSRGKRAPPTRQASSSRILLRPLCPPSSHHRRRLPHVDELQAECAYAVEHGVQVALLECTGQHRAGRLYLHVQVSERRARGRPDRADHSDLVGTPRHLKPPSSGVTAAFAPETRGSGGLPGGRGQGT